MACGIGGTVFGLIAYTDNTPPNWAPKPIQVPQFDARFGTWTYRSCTPTIEEAQAIGARVKTTIANQFGIAHATLELECEACDDGPVCAIDEPSNPR